ncbi:hypothetical protein [Arenivirga flava]|uniref:GCN5 family N-acetyltransferase n=1 Tax=Arenivirga flava TaxID=1930060 RepID=A0AA37XC65_9MICO|nr:hypothetical protein [Arenivirga flava]GMA29506.1 GCN5 family N-acetyltransferase [Arenivirga flava]
MGITIEAARRAAFPAVAELLARHLHDDPVYADFLGERPDRSDALRRFLRAYLRSTPPHRLVAEVAVDDDGTLLGAAVWERSGIGRDSAVVGQLPYALPFLRALGAVGTVRGLRVQGRLERFRPIEPHWYLMTSAGPEEVADALLRHRTARLDGDDVAAYVEAPDERMRALYERHGFVTGATILGLPTARPIAMFRSPGRAARRR